MELYTYLIEYFGIDALSESSTIIDLLNNGICIFVGIFLFCFILRSLFLLLRFGER